MKKLYVHSLAYNTAAAALRSLTLFENQKPDYPIEKKILVDVQYPIVKSQTKHSQFLLDLCETFGWEYVRPLKNMGVAGGWQWSINELGLGAGDVLFGNDLDGNPVSPKYLDATMKVMNADPTCVAVQLSDEGVYRMGNVPREESVIDGVNVIHYKTLTAWVLGSFDIGWVKKIGGMSQLHAYYGHIERAMYDKFTPLGGRVLMLKDFRDEHIKAEHPAYTAWKLECAQGITQLPLDKWLKVRNIKTNCD